MKILILRHGHAHASVNSHNDFERELSERGRAEITNNFHTYSDKLPSIDLVLVSPLKRAQQTADEFCRINKKINLTPVTLNTLQPDENPEQLLTELQHQKLANILLVTHQPLASSLIDLLCGTPFGFHSMATASMACIDCEYPAKGLGSLAWIHHPV